MCVEVKASHSNYSLHYCGTNYYIYLTSFSLCLNKHGLDDGLQYYLVQL